MSIEVVNAKAGIIQITKTVKDTPQRTLVNVRHIVSISEQLGTKTESVRIYFVVRTSNDYPYSVQVNMSFDDVKTVLEPVFAEMA